jgi:hypothetical protein
MGIVTVPRSMRDLAQAVTGLRNRMRSIRAIRRRCAALVVSVGWGPGVARLPNQPVREPSFVVDEKHGHRGVMLVPIPIDTDMFK